MKSPMLLRRTLHKTKQFVRRTLSCFQFGDYQKLHKAPFINPFSSSGKRSQKMQELDDLYRVFSEQWTSNLHDQQKGNTLSPKVLAMQDGECRQTTQKALGENAEMNKVTGEEGCKHNEGKGQEPSWLGKNGSSRVLAHKLKEFEMFEVDDVDHQLDIEEAIHYYSRLTCPVYVDIVDNFFMDMYSEFSHPEPSVSVNSSMRRLGPVKL